MKSVMKKIRETINEHSLVEKGDHIIVGISGGPDSVCLLHALYCLKEELNFKLEAVHVNHQIRGEAADKDQAFTESFCMSLDIPCHVFLYDIPRIAKETGSTSEEAGRKARYESFFKVLQETGGTRIAVAQNMNDQAETVLMRILRGTGTDGLSGMDYRRDQVIIRPLLDLTRTEIEDYCLINNLTPCIDLTNLEPIYTRNKIRLGLIPFIEHNFNGNIIAGLARLSTIAREDKEFIYLRVEEVLRLEATYEWVDGQEGPVSAHISCDALIREHVAIRKRIIVRIFSEIGLTQDINAAHLDSALKIIESRETNKIAEFPGGFIIRTSYEKLEFFKCSSSATLNKTGLQNRKMGILNKSVCARESTPVLSDSIYTKSFDYDRIVQSEVIDQTLNSDAGLTLRTRRRGDVFSPLGMQGSKKLKDFFIDEKIPQSKRDSIPILCLGSEVLWVIGYRMSDKYKVTTDTKNILTLEYSEPVC